PRGDMGPWSGEEELKEADQPEAGNCTTRMPFLASLSSMAGVRCVALNVLERLFRQQGLVSGATVGEAGRDTDVSWFQHASRLSTGAESRPPIPLASYWATRR